jgi:uncharacterized protein
MTELVTVLGLVLAAEGVLYALAPGGLKRAMAAMQAVPDDALRLGGVAALAMGVFLVWLARGGS